MKRNMMVHPKEFEMRLFFVPHYLKDTRRCSFSSIIVCFSACGASSALALPWGKASEKAFRRCLKRQCAVSSWGSDTSKKKELLGSLFYFILGRVAPVFTECITFKQLSQSRSLAGEYIAHPYFIAVNEGFPWERRIIYWVPSKMWSDFCRGLDSLPNF